MSGKLSFLLTLVFILLAITVYAEEAAPATDSQPTNAFEQLTGKITELEQKWEKQILKKPEIFQFNYPDNQKELTRREKFRLHVRDLQEKGKSNKAWYEYWQNQKDTLDILIPQYEKAIAAASASEDLKDEVEKLTIRKAGLEEWRKLCADKMKNQDVYLQAIDKEKVAYESRLEAFALAQAKAGATGIAQKDKDDQEPAIKEDGEKTPYRKHKAMLSQLKLQKEWHLAKELEAENDSEMTQKLIEAGKVLYKAQQADLALAKRELGIANKQVTCCKGDKPWYKLWKTIFDIVEKKVVVLTNVAETQADTVSRLGQEKSYYDSLIQIKKDKVQEMDALIKAEKKNVYVAVLLTSKQLLFSKGLIVLVYLVLGFISLRIIRFLGKTVIARVSDDDPDTLTDAEQRADTLVDVFSSLAKGAVFIIFSLLILDALGVNVGPLMGAFAIFGLAISFGSQNLVKDFVNGFFILLEGQLSVGDVVTVAGISGTVEKISLRRIVLRDVAGASHSIPNSQVDTVTNMTHGWARVIVHIGIGYGTDLRKAKEVFNEVGEKMYAEPEWNTQLSEAPSVVGVTELGDSAVVLRVWAKTIPSSQWAAERELNWRLYDACNANGIEIPFPQMVVEVKK